MSEPSRRDHYQMGDPMIVVGTPMSTNPKSRADFVPPGVGQDDSRRALVLELRMWHYAQGTCRWSSTACSRRTGLRQFPVAPLADGFVVAAHGEAHKTATKKGAKVMSRYGRGLRDTSRDGSIAQRLEQRTHNPSVAGSNPAAPIGCNVLDGAQHHQPLRDMFTTGRCISVC